jgi:Tol biopolymer transport system component
MNSVTLATMCALAVACGRDTTEPGVGALELTVSTTGRDLDADGYTVTVDAGNPVTVPTNGTLSIPDLSAGQHTVTLAALASNCVLGTSGPLQVTLPGPEGASARFEVTCSLIYTLAYQGSAGVELTDAAGAVHRTLVPDAKPLAWSPDGRLLAVVKTQDPNTIWLSNPDSGGLRQLTHVGEVEIHEIFTAKWAPDSRDLLYEVLGGPNSFPIFLRRMALDGSFNGSENYYAQGELACIKLMQVGTAPDWSPDGSQIVVHAPDYVEGPELYVLNREGTDQRLLTKGQQPDWSPDGSAIVFVAGPSACQGVRRFRSVSLHLISPDGSNERPLTVPTQQETDENPAWSPDGSKVAFTRLGIVDDSDVTSTLKYLVTSVSVHVIEADGTNEHQLALLPRDERDVHFMPSWSSDGQHLSLAGKAGTFVVNSDGSDFHMVSDVATPYIPALWRP